MKIILGAILQITSIGRIGGSTSIFNSATEGGGIIIATDYSTGYCTVYKVDSYDLTKISGTQDLLTKSGEAVKTSTTFSGFVLKLLA